MLFAALHMSLAHKADMPRCLLFVRFRRQSGKLSLSAFGPEAGR